MRLLIAGSDIWYVKEYQEFLQYCGSETRLINSYGLTEATIDSTYFEGANIDLTPERYIPIGRPFANTYIYILDRYFQPVPIGVPGELYIGGAGVAFGYLNQPELTAEKFVANPFISQKSKVKSPKSNEEETKTFDLRHSDLRLYRTGDLTRWLPDGNIEFLGRIDYQIKIRGFRVELGEIENRIQTYLGVREAVVITKKDQSGQNYLCAYVVADVAISVSQWREYLGRDLPEYMIPSYFVHLEKIPLTPNGKIDRKELPDLKVAVHSSGEYIAPRNAMEKRLAKIFGKVLNIEKVGIHDDFFKMGGHSLLVIKVLNKIKEELDEKVSLKDFYSHTSIVELERLITEGGIVDEMTILSKEAVLDADIQPRGICEAPLKQQSIFLTGCTGFVGRFLLYDLLQKEEATIYCLVRANSTLDALERIKTNLTEFELWDPAYEQRIVPVAGDLSKPDFGVGQNEYDHLCKVIEVIYHCGTYMNHLATYKEMKNTNVDGMKRILRFACSKRQKMINYISTVSIFNMNQSRHIDEMTPIESEIHYNSSGYNASKWVAEKIMLLARERGIPNNIYRLGLVTGDSQKGRCDSSQIFYRFLQSYLELGCYGYDNIDTKIWITPVDFVSQAIVHLSQCPERDQNYLLVNNEAINYIELIKYYNTGAKKPLQIVTSAEYFQKIKEYLKKGNTLPIVPIIQDIVNLSDEEKQFNQS
jgi:thioester reductase-like protein